MSTDMTNFKKVQFRVMGAKFPCKNCSFMVLKILASFQDYKEIFFIMTSLLLLNIDSLIHRNQYLIYGGENIFLFCFSLEFFSQA